MSNCIKGGEIRTVSLINFEDVKSIDENGLIMKRKYGNRLREIKQFKL